MEINFSSNVFAADAGKREISGRIVAWGEKGYTSAGETIFAPNSLTFNKKTKLLLEHDRTRPIGFLKSHEITATDVQAVFGLAKTFSADDAIEEASTGLRDGFSVGVKVDAWDNEDGVMVITAATVHEVSLVTDPAINSARVERVAASENAVEEISEPQVQDETKTQPEGEDLVSETISEVATAEVVEAAKSEPTVTANAPVAYTSPRVDLNVSAGQYAKAQILAARGDSDARDLVAALSVATVAENTGMVPPVYLRDIIGVIDASRPFIDSIERAALPAFGMKVFTPKLGAQAIVGLTAEGAEYASQDTAVTFQEDNVVKFAGAGVLDEELVLRSDPSFLDLYLRELAASYAQKTDAYAAKIAADGSQDSIGTTLYKAIALGIADSYNVMRSTPSKLLVAPSGGFDNIDFANILGAVDGSQRPLFAAANSQNAAGLVTQGSTNGTVAGLDLVVDPNYAGGTTGNKVAMVYPSNAMRFHESGTLQVRSNIVANGQLEIGISGFVAVVNRYPSAFRNIQIS
jgi:HK97 family phage prohead protease